MLVPTILKTSLQEIFDQESPSFKGFPENLTQAAVRWGDAFDGYAKAVIPISISSAAAKAAFITTFLTMNSENGLTQFPSCFHNYAIALAAGMTPLFTGVPPVLPPVLTPVFTLGLSEAKSLDCINLLVEIVDKWMRTGIAIQTTTKVPIPWS